MAQTAPPASEIIQRAVAANKLQSDKNWKYTFREDDEQVQLDKNGKPTQREMKTYDHIMLEGDVYKKLVLIDGKPLNAKTQKKVDEELAKTRAERRSRGFLHFNKTVELGDLEHLERMFENTVTGEETVLGRKTWRVESEPKNSNKAVDGKEQQILASRHIGWFDKETGVRIKWRDEFIRAANSFQPGSTTDCELTRVGEAWLMDSADLHWDITVVLGIHARVSAHQRYYDYKRFTVDSTMTPQ